MTKQKSTNTINQAKIYLTQDIKHLEIILNKGLYKQGDLTTLTNKLHRLRAKLAALI